jgi:predicted ATPase
LTELVGRDEELEILLRRWSKAKGREGQIVLLSGEAGIGKSRLTAALLEHIASEPHMRLRNFCSPQHTDSALYPTISQIGRAAGFTHEDTPQNKLNKLNALLAQTSTSVHDTALLAEMLSLPNDGRYPVLEITPQQRRQETLDALVLQVATLSRESPVLMIFEDAHLERPYEPRIIEPYRRQNTNPPRATDRDVSPRVRATVDRTALRDDPHNQPTAGARHQCDDRKRSRE